MAQTYVPGPAFVYVRPATEDDSAAWVALGVSQDGVTITFSTVFDPVMSDMSGPYTPLDFQYTGEDAFVEMILTLYNETTFFRLTARTAGSGLPNQSMQLAPGYMAPLQLGTLMIAENYRVELLVVCPYAEKNIFADMVPCWRFYSAWLDAQYMIPLSSRVKRPHVRFHCVTTWDQSNREGYLYSNVFNADWELPDLSEQVTAWW